MYILYRVESGCLSQRDPCHLFAPLQAPPCLPLPRPPMSALKTISVETIEIETYILHCPFVRSSLCARYKN